MNLDKSSRPIDPQVRIGHVHLKVCMANADALLVALMFWADNGIVRFPVNSQILPIKSIRRVEGEFETAVVFQEQAM